ncbi:unnamed protein product [Auanema sp. JU1783]|nr:unnamed protein product [Auanema sp. JU1783]
MTRLTSIKDYIVETFWTIFYFFYFLIKGNPRWKCETIEPQVKTNCCVNNHNLTQNGFSHNNNHQNYKSATYKDHPVKQKSFLSNLYDGVCNALKTGWVYTKRIARWSWSQVCKVGRLLINFWQWLMSIFGQPVPTKTLPATPKPFTPQNSFCDSPNYNKVVFDPILDIDDDQTLMDDQQSTVPTAAAPTPSDSESFYTQRVYAPVTDEPADTHVTQDSLREMSVPPPAPPPPPPKPIRIGTSVERDLSERKTPSKEFKEVKGGIPNLPADLMAELSGALRQERGHSAQREMTQSCHPDMAEWKTQERRERATTPHSYRASSVGPTMRRLEQVVSRLEDTTDDEAQFVFRPKQQNQQNGDGYRIGRSVFSPVEEVEQMRDQINRRTNVYDSRPVTPACSMKSYGGEASSGYDSNSNGYQYYRSNTVVNEKPSHSYQAYSSPYNQSESEVRQRHRSVGPHSQDSAGRTTPFQQSSAYSSMPFTSHTSRKSKTPTAFDRGSNFAYDRDSVTQGTVCSTVRQWPPVSNATGAPVEKDTWFTSFADENDDGLITTMARRVVERKVEDNWKWRDDSGKLVDEQNQRTWKGELDTVLRDGPNQGRHWSRTVEMLPTGDTKFQDVSRQYDRNFVVESIIRNY